MNEDRHLCAVVPVILIDVIRCMRIEWSIVSNAEEISSSVSIVPFLLSRLVSISLDISLVRFLLIWNEDMRFGRYEGFCVILNKMLVNSRRFVLMFWKISTRLILSDNF